MPERLRFERELADLGLREREDGGASQPREAVIGEKIILDLDEMVPTLAGTDLEKIQWVIPGAVVASYWGDRKSSKVTRPDLTRRRIEFHWLDAGDGLAVQCAVRAKMGGISVPLFYRFMFDVKAPRVDRFTAQTSRPVLVRERGTFQIRFGSFNKQGKKIAGIQWDWMVTMPPGHGGFIKDLQTVRHGREKIQRIEKGKPATRKLVRKHPTMGPHDQLDQSPGDAGSEATYSSKGYYPPAEFPMKLKAGESFQNDSTFDSPATALDPLDVKMTVDERFKYYVLFKPDKPGAIWVPLAKAEWFWKATATRGKDGAWRLSGAGGKVSKTTTPTTEHPIYASNADESEWVGAP